MQAYLKDKKLSTQTFTPSFCYRLDKDTSGVLIAATSYQALQWLNEQIRERHVKKEYLTRVVGEHPQRLVHDQPLHKVVDKKFGR
ncbi:hypothetical protein GW750_05320 [bacterium]|nr:hypothetical protein [bacterium]